MSKLATVASLVRNAARSETDFIQTVEEVFADGDIERAADFFDRLNIPRSTGGDALAGDLPQPGGAMISVTNFEDEQIIGNGIQRYLDRHERKLKWHATHPSLEGAENVLLLFREAMFVTALRLRRLQALLDKTDELTVVQWAISRELMNRSYLSFRNYLNLTAGEWIDAMNGAVPRDDLADKLGTFYELIDRHIRDLEDARSRIEDRRQEITVLPEGFPPVKPPNYFGGDLMGRGPWKQFWNNLNARAHHFRESVG
ncbi:MAG: hypothetical protein H6737_10490 [Alphaproteobacteria bacterium]|nr:hypothetical protein [Alphaproteobacteria bacterium]